MKERMGMAGIELSRREILKAGAVTALALALPEIFASQATAAGFGRAKSVVLLWLDGGPSHLDTFDPKPDAGAAIRGSFSAISTNVAGIRINEHLPLLARQMDKFAILRGVSHGEGGHERARHYLQTGCLPAASRAFLTYADALTPSPITLQSGNFTADCIRARQLVENGTRFVTVTLDGWDTHENHFPRLQNTLLPALDNGFSILLRELHGRGLLETTLVICMGEFGRSPQINRNALPGRDHWPAAMSVALAGGGICGGQVRGATDALGREPLEQAICVEDLAATIYHAAGHPSPIPLLSDESVSESPSVRVLRELW